VVNVTFVNSTYRKKFVRVNRHRQLLEVATVAFVLSTAWFFLPSLVPCLKKDAEFPEGDGKAAELKEATKGLWCEDPESEYNPLASLMFGSLEEIVNYLFLPSGNGLHPFPGGILVLYTILFGMGTCFIAGCSMATGIFIPMIVIGAGTGRSYAVLLQTVLPHLANIDPAAYAVCGAAGFVGGVTRISVAITVIMLEISNDLNLLMPIMLTAGIAKYTGDCLTEPYFEMVLHMRHVPFVEPEPGVIFSQLRCYQVMQRPVTCLPVEAKVMDVLKVLADTTHNGFPVVESMEEKKLHGIITRGHLQFIHMARSLCMRE
jgi:H+/Cl- antiporter ClcA